jgi:hypothetical protein
VTPDRNTDIDSGRALRFTPAPARLFFGRLWREAGAMVLLLPALWMLAGIPAMGWLRWLPPCVFGYAVILALGLRSRVRRSTLQLEREWLVQSVDTPKERRLALEWLQPGTGLVRGRLDDWLGTRQLQLRDGRRLRLETTGLGPRQLELLDRTLADRVTAAHPSP